MENTVELRVLCSYSLLNKYGICGVSNTQGKMSYACIIWGRKPERLRNRWEDNIKIYLELGYAGIKQAGPSGRAA